MRTKDLLLAVAAAAVGAAGVVVAGAAAFYLIAAAGYLPANADAKPPFLEKWIARKALKATIARTAPKAPNPVPLTDENLKAGIALYAVDCAVCHGGPDAQPSDIARGLYQGAPQLAKYGVEDDDESETYWKIYHGIRMTGMPAYHGSLSDEEIWKVTLFLKNMDSLPPGPDKAWKAVPSVKRAGSTTPNPRGHS